MNEVVITGSVSKIIRKHLVLISIGLPILLMYFGEDPRKSATRELNNAYLYAFFIYVVFVLIRLIYFIYKYADFQYVKMNSKGIVLNEGQFFSWDEIYDFRKIKTVTQIGNQNNGGAFFGEQTYLVINDVHHNFTWQKTKFTHNQIMEVIELYKQKLTDY